MYEKATALRLQFEYEKLQWEHKVKSKLWENQLEVQLIETPETKSYFAPSLNRGPPFLKFQAQEGNEPEDTSRSNGFQYEILEYPNSFNGHFEDKENFQSPSYWNISTDSTKKRPLECLYEEKVENIALVELGPSISKKRKFNDPSHHRIIEN